MEAIVLAGGRGTRLGPLTDDIPKPMLPVLGKPFLERLVDYWTREGITRFILSAGYRHEIIEAHFGNRKNGVPFTMSVEEKPLGTGGGLLAASRHLAEKGPFLCLNGDTFFAVNLRELAAFHAEKKAAVTLSLFEPAVRDRYEGVALDGTGKVTGWIPRGGRERGPANGGVYLMERGALDRWDASAPRNLSLESAMLPVWLGAGEAVYGHLSNGAFIDIGTPEDLARAGNILGAAGA